MRDAERASDVISRMRALMRKSPAYQDAVNFNDLVREGLEMMQGELRRRKVDVSTGMDPQLPLIHGERIQLQQVFLNLSLNANDAMSTVTTRPRQLTIKTGRPAGDADGIVVDVCDTGAGVDEENIDKLFTAFFSTKPEGSGLGLWISQSIVESHAGKLFAFRNTQLSVRAMKAGALDFLQKPFREQDLLDAIHIALSRSAAASAAAQHRSEGSPADIATPAATARASLCIRGREPAAGACPQHPIQIGRTILSWSQEELGGKCSLHRSHISALEREELSVGVDAIDQLAAAFRISPHVLLMSPLDAQSMLLQSFNGVDGKTRRLPRTIKK